MTTLLLSFSKLHVKLSLSPAATVTSCFVFCGNAVMNVTVDNRASVSAAIVTSALSECLNTTEGPRVGKWAPGPGRTSGSVQIIYRSRHLLRGLGAGTNHKLEQQNQTSQNTHHKDNPSTNEVEKYVIAMGNNSQSCIEKLSYGDLE